MLGKSCSSTVMKAPGLYNAQQFSVKWVQTSENRANLSVCSLCERFDFTSKQRIRRISQNRFLDIALLHKGTPQFLVQRLCKSKALFAVAPRAYMTAMKGSNSSIVRTNVSSYSWRWTSVIVHFETCLRIKLSIRRHHALAGLPANTFLFV